jgi:fumarate hydratase subunit alpha
MQQLETKAITLKVRDALMEAGVRLPPDITAALNRAAGAETGRGCAVLRAVTENLAIADRENLPLCQDTGMVLFFVRRGEHLRLTGESLEKGLNRAVEEAYSRGYFRRSVVRDPLKERTNTGTNTPAIVWQEMVEGDSLTVEFLLKGFGSENCCRTWMLKPTAGKEDVIQAVCETVRLAGGGPCPPTVLGLGLGGTMDYAAYLSKKALLRDLDNPHPDPWYAALEKEILDRVNALGIGPGGLGGTETSLGVKLETFATHIAGMPLAVSVNCWADRKGRIVWKGDQNDNA